MNERIQELASQCWDRRLDGMHFDQEKFAELMVQECINEVEGLQVLHSTLDWSQHWNRAIAHTALHLKEHFGVEE